MFSYHLPWANSFSPPYNCNDFCLQMLKYVTSIFELTQSLPLNTIHSYCYCWYICSDRAICERKFVSDIDCFITKPRLLSAQDYLSSNLLLRQAKGSETRSRVRFGTTQQLGCFQSFYLKRKIFLHFKIAAILTFEVRICQKYIWTNLKLIIVGVYIESSTTSMLIFPNLIFCFTIINIHINLLN